MLASALRLPANAQQIPAASSSPSQAAVTLPPIQIVLTPTRSSIPAKEESSDAIVVTQDDIEASGQPVLDDVLRPIPGFNTFRRSSSMVTAPADDPEAQGVTLRGIGPGGASHALVLYDGVPINDAFGGWIYWDEISLTTLERIEVVQGAVPLWGSGAEGGVINLIPAHTIGDNAQFDGYYGTRNTMGNSVSAGYALGAFQLDFESSIFNTRGWDIVAPAYRGPIDQNSSSFHYLTGGRIQFKPNDHLTLFVGGHYYDENRDLGTPFRTASANRFFFEGGASWLSHAGHLSLIYYSHISSMDENYSLVNQPRTVEIPLQIQHVPSTDVGGTATWAKRILPHNQFLAGGDFRLIDGQSDDSYYNTAGSAVDDRKVSSGRQTFFGAFLEDVYRPTEQLEADFSVRSDLFQNLNGQIKDSPVGENTAVTRFPNRTRTATNPKLGARYSVTRWLTVRGDLYEAFRAPTLAELYRQSSVESLVLVPNPKLSPEFLQGGEAGLMLQGFGGMALNLTGYWDILHKPISNVVTAVNPETGADAQRTRENLCKAQIRGYEVRFEYHPTSLNWYRWAKYNPDLHLVVDYLRSEAKLVYNTPDPTLEGRRLALVPWNTGTGQVIYGDNLLGITSLQVAYQGMQWEDSDNHDRQPAYWLVNLTWSHELPHLAHFPQLKDAAIFIKVQNLLDHSYVIDTGGGIPKLGTPFMLQGGIMAPLSF
jgi:outer membrane receptor protein involved in Fe transport